MSSTHGRPSSHAPSRPPSAHRLSSHQRTLSTEHRRHSQSLQGRRDAPPVSHKRRGDDGVPEDTKRHRPNDGFLSADELLKPPIIVRAHPPNPVSRPCTLLPLMLLPREHLPLSSLDLAAPKGDLPSSRLFQSEIRILELEGRLGSNILIARSPSSNSGSSGGFSSASSIFAIERDEAGLYVLCKLGSWVNIHKLGEKATALCQQRMPASPKAAASTEGLVLATAHVHQDGGKKRLAIAELQSIVRRKPALQTATDASLAQTPIDGLGDTTINEALDDLPARFSSQTSVQASSVKEAALPTPPASDSTKVAPPPPIPEPTGPPTADDIFQNIRHQYQEALYHSMGSLAYFAKGPLSRARAAFHLNCDSNLEMGHLIDFLRSLVLTTTIIDKKYRETVPELVNHLRTFGHISDHDEPKKKSKKPKRIKLGSSGLYTGEDIHIRTWWAANKPPPRDDEVFPRSEEAKYAVSCLRTRETQMQMILILEIMALETMRPLSDPVDIQLPGMTPTTDAQPTTPAKKEAPRKKNKHNLPLLIDVHADRLCIWQSTISDEVLALAEAHARPNNDLSVSQTSQSLQDFCVDIIVPFFYPRLPQVCDSLNRKLGGPVITTPSSRSKPPSGSAKSPSAAKSLEKLSSSKHQQRPKPGSSLRRTASSSNSARNLERVLSNEKLRRSVSRGPNDAIAQMRNATAAPIPGLKREASEPLSLANVPCRSSSTSLKDRPASTLARSSSDGSAATIARVEEARARKKAHVEAQLQEAISALKKPNRELVGKAVVADAEMRRFGVTGHVRKVKKPVRAAAAGDHRVQVKATPVNNRFRDVFVTTSTESHGLFGGGQAEFGQPQPLGHCTQAEDYDHLFGPHGQHPNSVSASPRVAATPLAGRIQATPVRTASTSVPDSTVKAASALPSRETLVATAGNTLSGGFRISRSSALESFPEEETILMSSPVAARRALRPASTQPSFNKSYGEAATDMISGWSSPLQARSQPRMSMATANAPVSETPTKAKAVFREETTFATSSIMATPPPVRPAATGTVPIGGIANSVQSLYQQMGWDDDLDDLA